MKRGIKERILSELEQGFALSDEDLATRLQEREASVRRTRRQMLMERLIEFAGHNNGQDTYTTKQTW